MSRVYIVGDGELERSRAITEAAECGGAQVETHVQVQSEWEHQALLMIHQNGNGKDPTGSVEPSWFRNRNVVFYSGAHRTPTPHVAGVRVVGYRIPLDLSVLPVPKALLTWRLFAARHRGPQERFWSDPSETLRKQAFNSHDGPEWRSSVCADAAALLERVKSSEADSKLAELLQDRLDALMRASSGEVEVFRATITAFLNFSE